MDDDQEEHTVGSLDTSMDRYLERLRLWRKRIPQGLFFFWKKRIENFVFVCLDGSSLFRAVSEAVRNNE
jgi:hypothetical protein